LNLLEKSPDDDFDSYKALSAGKPNPKKGSIKTFVKKGDDAAKILAI
jgi:hypothetical protein